MYSRNVNICSRRKLSKRACTGSLRNNKCQWAEGSRRSFCRKISKKRLRENAAARIQSQHRSNKRLREKKRTREKAAVRIQSQHRKRSNINRINALSPTGNHFQKVANLRAQGSIRIFYERCRLFPHPIMMFSEGGIDVPVNANYAKILMTKWNRAHVLLKHMPNLKKNQHIYTHEGLYYDQEELENTEHVFRKAKFSTNLKDVIIGIKYVRGMHDPNDGHVVFFEVRMEDTPTAIVIDPNGTNDRSRRWVLDIFFRDIPYKVIESFNINMNESFTSPALSRLGFQGSFDIKGYCATIACFTLVDYVCTNQWNNVDLRHYTRATREWLYAPEENRVGEFCTGSVQLRLNIMSRYIAYHLVRLMEIPHDMPTLEKVTITVRRQKEYLKTRFKVGREATTVVGKPKPISELETSFDALRF